MKTDKTKQFFFQWSPKSSNTLQYIAAEGGFIWKDESAKNNNIDEVVATGIGHFMLILKKSWTGCWWFSLHACLIHPWRHHHHHLVSRLTADVYKVATTIPKRNTFWRLSSSESTVASNHKFHSFLAGNKRRHNRVI